MIGMTVLKQLPQRGRLPSARNTAPGVTTTRSGPDCSSRAALRNSLSVRTLQEQTITAGPDRPHRPAFLIKLNFRHYIWDSPVRCKPVASKAAAHGCPSASRRLHRWVSCRGSPSVPVYAARHKNQGQAQHVPRSSLQRARRSFRHARLALQGSTSLPEFRLPEMFNISKILQEMPPSASETRRKLQLKLHRHLKFTKS